MTEAPREITKAEYEATFSPPMLDLTESAEEIVDLWAYADSVIAEKYHSCTAWEWQVKFIYESRDGSYQHINIPVPKDDTYLVVIVDKPNRKIIGHYILDLCALGQRIMIEKEIEAILAWQDVGDDGDIDVDGVMKAFERLTSIATEADLPALVAAIQSPKNNFWTRELFAEPICRLGGVDYLEPLLEAAQLGLDEGHDNDSFDVELTELAEAEPEKCRAKLEELLARDDFKHHEIARWLLEYCET